MEGRKDAIGGTSAPPSVDGGPVVLNLQTVLPYMQYRKKLRFFNGLYTPSDAFRLVFFILVIFILWTFDSAFFRRERKSYEFGVVLSLSYSLPGNRDASDGISIFVNVLTYTFMVLTMVLIALHASRHDPYMQFLCVFFVVLLIVVLSRRNIVSANDNRQGSGTAIFTQDIVMQAFVYIALLHMAFLALRRWLIPHLTRRDSGLMRCAIRERHDLTDPALVARLIALPPEYAVAPDQRLVACYIRYVCPWWLPLRGRPETITYVGEIDEVGRPSGYGEWRDTHWHGEHMTGFWYRGLPTGPFCSRETGSASGFQNLRIAYFRNRGEQLRKAACLPRLKPLQFGIVACEVSTSGAWFKSLPKLRELLPPVDIAEGLRAEEEAARLGGRIPTAMPGRASSRRGGGGGGIYPAAAPARAGERTAGAEAAVGVMICVSAAVASGPSGPAVAAAAVASGPSGPAVAAAAAPEAATEVAERAGGRGGGGDVSRAAMAPALVRPPQGPLRGVAAAALLLRPGSAGRAAPAALQAGGLMPSKVHSEGGASLGLEQGDEGGAGGDGPSAVDGVPELRSEGAAAAQAEAGAGAPPSPPPQTEAAAHDTSSTTKPQGPIAALLALASLGRQPPPPRAPSSPAVPPSGSTTWAAAAGTNGANVATVSSGANGAATPRPPPGRPAPVSSRQAIPAEPPVEPTLVHRSTDTILARTGNSLPAILPGSQFLLRKATGVEGGGGSGNGGAGASLVSADTTLTDTYKMYGRDPVLLRGLREAQKALQATSLLAPGFSGGAAAARGTNAAGRPATSAAATAAGATGPGAVSRDVGHVPRLVSMLMPLMPAHTTLLDLRRRDAGNTFSGPEAIEEQPAVRSRPRFRAQSHGRRWWRSGGGFRTPSGRQEEAATLTPAPAQDSAGHGGVQPQEGSPPMPAQLAETREGSSSGPAGLRVRRRRWRRSSEPVALVTKRGGGGGSLAAAPSEALSEASGPVHHRALLSFIKSSQAFMPGNSDNDSVPYVDMRDSGRESRPAKGAAARGGGGGGGDADVGTAAAHDTATGAVTARLLRRSRWEREELVTAVQAAAISDRPAARMSYPVSVGALSRPPEALLFVHGLGVDMHKALRHYAQMLALITFPPYISPVLFSWPSSVPLAYFWARYRAAEAPQTGLALAATVRSLAADGFRRLHILVHSMGTRVLMNALPHLEAILGSQEGGERDGDGGGDGDRGGLCSTPSDSSGHRTQDRRRRGSAGLVSPLHSPAGSGAEVEGEPEAEQEEEESRPGRMRLQTVTICNPDFGLKRFTEEMGPRLRALCPHVTLYGDTADGALRLSEVVNALARPFVGASAVLSESCDKVPTLTKTAAAAVTTKAARVYESAAELAMLRPRDAPPTGPSSHSTEAMPRAGGGGDVRGGPAVPGASSPAPGGHQAPQRQLKVELGRGSAPTSGAAAAATAGSFSAAPVTQVSRRPLTVPDVSDPATEAANDAATGSRTQTCTRTAPAVPPPAPPPPPPAPPPPPPAPLPAHLEAVESGEEESGGGGGGCDCSAGDGVSGGSEVCGRSDDGKTTAATISAATATAATSQPRPTNAPHVNGILRLNRSSAVGGSGSATGSGAHVRWGSGVGPSTAPKVPSRLAPGSSRTRQRAGTDGEASTTIGAGVGVGTGPAAHPAAAAAGIGVGTVGGEGADGAGAVVREVTAGIDGAGGGSARSRSGTAGDGGGGGGSEDIQWWSERVVDYRRRLQPRALDGWLELSLGRRIYQIVDTKTGVPLDLDVVDLSYLSSNVNSVRHTHFALNREILDDLWEVIVLGRRAAQRTSRLEHVTGNVYSMSVAPSYLSTKQI